MGLNCVYIALSLNSQDYSSLSNNGKVSIQRITKISMCFIIPQAFRIKLIEDKGPFSISMCFNYPPAFRMNINTSTVAMILITCYLYLLIGLPTAQG